jgi:hypothetical protein
LCLGRLFAFLLLLLPAAASAHEILIVQSSRLRAYEEASRAFRRGFDVAVSSAGPKQVQRVEVSSLVLSEATTDEDLAPVVRSRRPDLVSAIGTRAFLALRESADIPLVYLFVPNAASLAKGRPNVSGVSFEVPPDASLKGLLRIAPGSGGRRLPERSCPVPRPTDPVRYDPSA